METMYSKVEVEKKKPNASGFYWIENLVGEMKCSYYDAVLKMFTSSDYAKFWLIPIQETQLQKDKEELIEMLDKSKSELYKSDNLFATEIQIFLNKINS